MTPYQRPGQTSLVPGVEFTNGINLRSGNGDEGVLLAVAMPPSTMVIRGLRRMNYRPGSQPTVANLIAAFREYGITAPRA